ncbi:MAG TPA: NAD(P)/FAD-dependent oxidoreductase [Phycisphaerales bacterium]|nr:NAD(P)/FAD-dependent oxidoreductase [Phycisphaerales bacterium]
MNGPRTGPHVVILGGGFAGLYAARTLRRAPVQISLIDRSNHHVFQPLLYQVATASLSPADIAAPIRHVLAGQKNIEVLLAEATAIDVNAKKITLADGEITYDYLILATGATHSYFGHDDWAPFAPGLKTIDDALEIRRRFLLAFERAERETDPVKRRAALTFVVVGGGPTGVELAGAMAEIARRAIPRDFRRIDTTTARVILVEGEDRVLPPYPTELSRRAKDDLEKLGVEVWLHMRVTGIRDGLVEIGNDRIAAGNVIWAAGVHASPLAASLGAPMDRAGRVLVQPDLSIEGHPEVFVVGDLAAVKDKHSNDFVPGIAPAAMQMGRHAARIIAHEARSYASTPRATTGGRSGPTVVPTTAALQSSAKAPMPAVARQSLRPPFRYNDKGMLATIGRAKAVGLVKGVKIAGWFAWLSWLFIHILYLIGFRNRILVLIQWAWAYITFDRGARLITGMKANAPKL